LGILWLTGCGAPDRPQETLRVTEEDSAGITVVTIRGNVSELPVWTLPDPPLGEIDGYTEPYLAAVGEVAFRSDGSLLVSSGDELHLFDATGKHLGLVGRAGDGPKEFRSLATLSVIPGDLAFAYDQRLRKLVVFGPRADFMNTVPILRDVAGPGTAAMAAWGLDPENFLLQSSAPPRSPPPDHYPRRDERDALLLLLRDGERVGGHSIRFDGGYGLSFMDQGGMASPFAHRPVVSVNSGLLVYGSGLEYELTMADSSLRPMRVVRWIGWRKPLTDELVEEVRREVEKNLEAGGGLPPDVYDRVFGALLSPDLLPPRLPALGQVLLDDTGRLWVSPFELMKSRWGQEDAWHVLDESGHPLARVALPSNAYLAAVKRDRIAVVTRDSLDVQHLRVFAIQAVPSEAH
jgi:hypothetical protein